MIGIAKFPGRFNGRKAIAQCEEQLRIRSVPRIFEIVPDLLVPIEIPEDGRSILMDNIPRDERNWQAFDLRGSIEVSSPLGYIQFYAKRRVATFRVGKLRPIQFVVAGEKT